MTTEEIWKAIPEYEEYQVSNLGNFKRKDGEISKIKPKKRTGYIVVGLCLGSIKSKIYTPLHVLIAKTFIVNDNPEEKIMVNHIDGNRSNNIVSNLEYVTPKENANKKIYKKEPYTRKIAQIDDAGTIIKEWRCANDAALALSSTEKTIRYACMHGNQVLSSFWRYLGEKKHLCDDLENEKWTKGIYKEHELTVSNKGRIITLSGGKTYGATKNGYRYIRICSDKKMYPIHQIICTIFNGKAPTEKHLVNHIDNNGSNNCPDNLAWVTQSENVKHGKQFMHFKNLAHSARAVQQFSLTENYIASFKSIADAARENRIDSSSINNVCRLKSKTAGGFIWRYEVP